MASIDLRAARFDLSLPPTDSVALVFRHPDVDLTGTPVALWVQSAGNEPAPGAAITTATLDPGDGVTTGTLDVSMLPLGVDHRVVLTVGSGWAMGRAVRSVLTTDRQVHEVQVSFAEANTDLTLVVGPGGGGGAPGEGMSDWDRITLNGLVHRDTFASIDSIQLEPAGAAIAQHGTGDWDALQITEPGNVVYDPVTDTWICPYSGRDATLNWAAVGAVISTDGGKTWGPHPQNPIAPWREHPDPTRWWTAEDPYIAKDAATGHVHRDSEGRALMFIEHKAGATHFGVGLWRSAPNTLDDWEWFGEVLHQDLNEPAEHWGQWDQTDRTSPTVVFDGEQLVMLFEGRWILEWHGYPLWAPNTAYQVDDITFLDLPKRFFRCTTAHTSTDDDPETAADVWEPIHNQEGEVGIAFGGPDGTHFTPAVDPIIERQSVSDPNVWFDVSIVPDDLQKIGDVWVLTCHGQTGTRYVEGRFATLDDPADWGPDSWVELPGNPLSTITDTVMFWGTDPARGMWIRDNQLVPVRVVGTDTGGGGWDEARVAALEGRVTSIEGRLDLVEGTDTEQDGRLTGLEADRDDLWQWADGADDRLDGHDDLIAALDARGDELEWLLVETTAHPVELAGLMDGSPLNPADIAPLNPASDLTLPDATIVWGQFNGHPLMIGGAFPDAPPIPGALFLGARLRGVEVTGAAEGVGHTIELFAQPLDLLAGHALVRGDTNLTPRPGLAGVDVHAATNGPADVLLLLAEPLADPTGVVLAARHQVASSEVTVPFDETTVGTASWLWLIPTGGNGGGRWIEVARHEAQHPDDWPVFTNVPPAFGCRIHWHLPGGGTGGAGGLRRDILLTIDGDTSDAYRLPGTNPEPGSSIKVGELGQGGGAFGEVHILHAGRNTSQSTEGGEHGAATRSEWTQWTTSGVNHGTASGAYWPDTPPALTEFALSCTHTGHLTGGGIFTLEVLAP